MWNCHRDTLETSSPPLGSKPTTTSDFQATFCLRRTFLLHILPLALTTTAKVHTAGRCCAVVWFDIPIRWLLYSLLSSQQCGNLLVEMAVWVWNSMDSMVCTDTLMTLVILFSWFLDWWYLQRTRMGRLPGQLPPWVHMGTCWLSEGASPTHVCHIAPSHRRLAHPSWIAGMKLMLDLLLGARKHRYLRLRQVDPRPAQVYVRGFSAGSYSGICLLHLLWNMPHVQVGGILGGIACPPALLHGIQPDHGAQLMLIHLTTDRLCQWHPRDETLSSLTCKYCIVDRSTPELREHFGTSEHSYGHWIDLSLPHGRYLLRQYPFFFAPCC